jgi:Bacterial regulatory proteins, tetR family
MDEDQNKAPTSDRAPRGAVRSRMVEGAVKLLATKGVEGTSFSEVLEASDAPRGSVYHHWAPWRQLEDNRRQKLLNASSPFGDSC